MQIHRPFVLATLLFCLPVLGACGSGQSTDPASSSGTLAGTIDHALDRAKEKLRTKNITISDDDNAANTLPKAEITPEGDLLIAGKPVAVTPRQRQMLQDYRRQVVEIGEQGIDIGKQGTALGLHAAGEALTAVFSGKSEQQIRDHVEAQAADIRQAAAQICNRLPALMASQQELAAALPAFKPYARMTQQDIDDCHTDASHDSRD